MQTFKFVNSEPFLSVEAMDTAIQTIESGKPDVIDLTGVQRAQPRVALKFLVATQGRYKFVYSPFFYNVLNVIKKNFWFYCEGCMGWFEEEHEVCPNCGRKHPENSKKFIG